MARLFKVKIDGVTLPGAGMMSGAGPDARPFVHAGDHVEEGDLGDHILSLYDSEDPRTRALFEEVDPSDDGDAAEEVQGEEPWEGYDSTAVKDVLAKIHEDGDDPDFIEKVKQYESLRTSPRKGILSYEPGDGSEA